MSSKNVTMHDSLAEEARLHPFCLEEEVVWGNKVSLSKVRSWKTRHSKLLDFMFGYSDVRDLCRAGEVQIFLPSAPPNC